MRVLCLVGVFDKPACFFWMSPCSSEPVVLEAAAYREVSVGFSKAQKQTHTCGAIVSVRGTLAEVLAVARVDTLLEATLAVGLALALIGHLVVLIALLGGALERDTLNIALVLGHVLAVGGLLGLGLAGSGLVVGLGLLLGLVTLAVLQSTALVLLLAVVLRVVGLGLGLVLGVILGVILGIVIAGLFLRLVLGLLLGLLDVRVLLNLLSVGIARTVSITIG